MIVLEGQFSWFPCLGSTYRTCGVSAGASGNYQTELALNHREAPPHNDSLVILMA